MEPADLEGQIDSRACKVQKAEDVDMTKESNATEEKRGKNAPQNIFSKPDFRKSTSKGKLI